ncbi:MAG: polymerase subunit sigma-70 [Segetibacter sp.]|jgi:RNA polymerase sigma factor (sigma-70 family)|nr:polymerase subunit sigma-70 [Segetibacter sp.]
MGKISTKTELELIKECKKGIRKSQKEFYDLYSPKLFLLCLRYSNDRTLAEDILQDAFIKIFINLHKYRGDGSFEGWMRRITVNAAIECLRRNKRAAYIPFDEEPILVCDQPSALENLFEKDLINKTCKLSAGYKEVFDLYAIEGYSHKEISIKLKITESTSKSQYSRAKSALRDMVV